MALASGIAGLRHSSLSALRRNLAKGQTTVGMDGVAAGKGLPTPDRYIDVTRIQFHRTGLASDPFGRKQGRAGTAEGIDHNLVALGAILDRIGDEGDGLDGRVRTEVIHASRAERV